MKVVTSSRELISCCGLFVACAGVVREAPGAVCVAGIVCVEVAGAVVWEAVGGAFACDGAAGVWDCGAASDDGAPAWDCVPGPAACCDETEVDGFESVGGFARVEPGAKAMAGNEMAVAHNRTRMAAKPENRLAWGIDTIADPRLA